MGFEGERAWVGDYRSSRCTSPYRLDSRSFFSFCQYIPGLIYGLEPDTGVFRCGLQILVEFFPGLSGELMAVGAQWFDWIKDPQRPKAMLAAAQPAALHL